MPGLHETPPHVQHRAVADARGDLAQLERELGRTGERVAPLVHRRRAGVRGLAAPGDPVALDAERAEHRAERQVQRLEHRPLLDVELEVGGRVLELRARLERPVEVDAVLARARRGARSRRGPCSCAQLVLVGHRARGRGGAEERAAEARALLVGPVDEPDGDRRRALLRDPAQHLDRRRRRSGSRRASRRSARSRCARRAGARAPTRRAASTTGSRPRRPRTRAAGPRASSPSHSFACTHVVGPRDPLRAVLVAGQLAQLAQLGDGSGRDRAARRDSNDRSAPCGKHYAVAAATVAVSRVPGENRERSGPPRPRRACSSSVLAALWALWEALKWFGETTGFRLGSFEVNDRTLPHLHDIVSTLFEPSRRNGPLLIDVLFDAALFTAKEAAAGFLLGAVARVRARGRARPLALCSSAASCPTSSPRRRSRSSRSRRWSSSG